MKDAIYLCETCGELLPTRPKPEFHEDVALEGAIVVEELQSSPQVRVYHPDFPGRLACIPTKLVREGSIRRLGERGTFIFSRWLAIRRGWHRIAEAHGGDRVQPTA